MADDDTTKKPFLAPPAVAALRGEPTAKNPRIPMERTISEDIREQRQDLREAAEHSLNVVMDLGLDGCIRWVSPSWEQVVGTPVGSVQGKPITDFLVGNASTFADTVETMKKDDSRSQIIRFQVKMGPLSVLRPRREENAIDIPSASPADLENDHVLNLEAQGIMVYDLTSGVESHTMWMLRPAVVREVTIDLPKVLVNSLGVGAEVLAQYLTTLAEQGATDPASHAPPLPVLCRICERQITPWWFEKHTEVCLQEHRSEMEVQIAQENLAEHRNAIVKVLDAFEAASNAHRAPSVDPVTTPTITPEYKGLPINPPSTPSSGPSSGRASPASPPSRSLERSTGIGHQRARSFAVRRPVTRIVELVLDLCDTAMEINTPAIKETRGAGAEIRTQSPQSENRISQVIGWQSPSSGSMEQEPGLAALCEDTARLAKDKVDAVIRHRRILEYSERIRCEFDLLVHECIDEAMRKAARLAAGEDSDSSGSEFQIGEETPNDTAETPLEEGIFAGSFDGGPSAMAQALRNASENSLPARLARRTSSGANSARSSSPRGTQTPRSHGGAMSIVSQSKRASMHLESDAGAESDTSVRSSVFSGPRRADSPGSELGLTRVASSRERKRRSLILPSVMGNSRQQSPARNMAPPPSSPLRMSKPRFSSGAEGAQSPITSPVLSTSDFSSPVISAQQMHHHRRQSSTAGSDVLRMPVSPRLIPASNPQPRAVPPSIKDFEIIKPISKGAFGSVYLSKKKSTGDYYAIKVLKKADMIAKNQVTNVKAERAIMMWQSESDFVAKLYWTFSSKDYLYLVMEYLNGGDCASLIKVLGALPEDWAKKYLAEVVLGVEHLHNRGIVHRDLKPDNLLIGPQGHLKLTDFGLSRMGLIGRQKRVLNSKAEDTAPDLLKQGPFQRAPSGNSSRSASFDLQGNISPSQTPSLTPACASEVGQPSYFSLSRETSHHREASRRTSGARSDNGDTETLQTMFRRFSIAQEDSHRQNAIEEEGFSDDGGSPDPYAFLYGTSHYSGSMQSNATPPPASILPPPMALFDPQDNHRRFVGTPDYLAPETISGVGQDEMSDWWSLGCIMFECLYGYPPFHADTPDQVFENILARRIDWPEDDSIQVSEEAKDLMNKLMCTDPSKRLGANAEDKYSCGGEEIRAHPWFADINWETLRDDEASFVPATENPEDTEYFDARGATMNSFGPEFEDQTTSNTGTPGADYPDRPHDALSRVRSQVHASSMKRGLIPLHIPPHVREGQRTRRLSEPVASDDFGSFAYKNLPVLEKANKDVIQKLRAEAMQAQTKPVTTMASPLVSSPSPSLDTSPMAAPPLKRTLSTNKGPAQKSVSPSFNAANSSPSRSSQPSSPLLVSFSTGQGHERRKTSTGLQAPGSLQPGSFFDVPRAPVTPGAGVVLASSPVKVTKTQGVPIPRPQDRNPGAIRQSSLTRSSLPSPRARSQTVGSQDSNSNSTEFSTPSQYKRRSQVFDLSPSSSDNEDSRQKALLRVQRRRQSSQRLSQITLADGPVFRPLDILICEDHPVSRLVMEKLLEKLRCRTMTVTNGPDAIRYATSEVKFDIIMTEFRLPQINGADVARMIRETRNANSNTPIVAVTGYLKELSAPHYFDGLIDKPPTLNKLSEILGKLCQWKPAPPGWTPSQYTPSTLRQESLRLEDSPTSNSSGFQAVSGSYGPSSREDSISSSFFGDTDSRSDEVPVRINRHTADEWRDREMSRALGGLGISEEHHAEVAPKSLPSEFRILHQSSAPPILQHTPVKEQRPAEQLNPKRRSLERKHQDSAESGDDEDEELGDSKLRTRSPRNRPKRSSKLGVEMLRTNSHGSVVSVEDVAAADTLCSSPPPVISEDPISEAQSERRYNNSTHQPSAMTPPEIFPQPQDAPSPNTAMDVTPRPSHPAGLIDPDPTPKATGSPLRHGTQAEE